MQEEIVRGVGNEWAEMSAPKKLLHYNGGATSNDNDDDDVIAGAVCENEPSS